MSGRPLGRRDELSAGHRHQVGGHVRHRSHLHRQNPVQPLTAVFVLPGAFSGHASWARWCRPHRGAALWSIPPPRSCVEATGEAQAPGRLVATASRLPGRAAEHLARHVRARTASANARTAVRPSPVDAAPAEAIPVEGPVRTVGMSDAVDVRHEHSPERQRRPARSTNVHLAGRGQRRRPRRLCVLVDEHRHGGGWRRTDAEGWEHQWRWPAVDDGRCVEGWHRRDGQRPQRCRRCSPMASGRAGTEMAGRRHRDLW